MTVPQRIAKVVYDITSGKDIDVLPLLDLPSIDYQFILALMKRKKYVCLPGSLKYSRRKRNAKSS